MKEVLDRGDDTGAYLKEFFNGKVPIAITDAINPNDMFEKFAEDYALVYETPWGIEYKYPCIDLGNTIASAIYFNKYASELPREMREEAEANINRALQGFGLQNIEIEKIAYDEVNMDAVYDAYITELFGNDHEEDYLRLSPLEKRASSIENYTGNTYGTNLEAGFKLRRNLCIENEEAEEVLDMLLEKCASEDPETIATVLYDFDKRYHLAHLYDTNLPDPYLTVFGSNLEEIHPLEKIAMGNEEFSEEELASKITDYHDDLIDVLGVSGVQELSKNPVSVLRSLPNDIKATIAKICGA